MNSQAIAKKAAILSLLLSGSIAINNQPAINLAQKSDSDGIFTLLGANVTRGQMKNLVTDKPAPITVALAQVKGNDATTVFNLLGANVTKGQMKNLITDKPAPITVALAQQ